VEYQKNFYDLRYTKQAHPWGHYPYQLRFVLHLQEIKQHERQQQLSFVHWQPEHYKFNQKQGNTNDKK
jgi:hypothetical protein